MPKDDRVSWYDIRGLHDIDIIQNIGALFTLHPLVLEDIADVHQRPKFDEYKDYCFLKFDSLKYENGQFEKESISIVLGENYVISFQEDEKDTLHYVRERILSRIHRIKDRGADYLAYALLDQVVDSYFESLDMTSMDIEKLDERITLDPTEGIKKDIQNLKVEYLHARKSIAPLREAVVQFSKSDHSVINPNTSIYIRDAYDHLIQIMDIIETNSDILSGLQD